jgi:membrane protein YdbS with pleckstrin-like domain
MESLDPRVRLLWGLSAALGIALLAGIVGFAADRLFGRPLAGAVVAVIGVPLAGWHVLVRYRRWRFELQDDTIYLERGVLTLVETAVPYVRVQHVDTQRGPLERTLGLSSVVVYTAGSRGADVTIPGLTTDRARELRNRLRELAIESEPGDAV